MKKKVPSGTRMRRYPTIPASLRSLCSPGKAVGRTRDCRDVMHDDPGCAALTRATPGYGAGPRCIDGRVAPVGRQVAALDIAMERRVRPITHAGDPPVLDRVDVDVVHAGG